MVALETASDVLLVCIGPFRHQTWDSHHHGKQPDDNADDDPSAPVIWGGGIQRPGHRPVPVDADGPEEEDGAVVVDEEQRAGQPTQEVVVGPVTVLTVIPDPEGKGTHEQEICDG